MIVDNYFPDDIVYKNIRLYDEEESELLPWWNDTYKFLKRAIKRGGKCLVHCRMGISRCVGQDFDSYQLTVDFFGYLPMRLEKILSDLTMTNANEYPLISQHEMYLTLAEVITN